MGRQALLRLLAQDVCDLEDALRERRALFLRYYHLSPEPELCSTLDPRAVTDPILCLARPEDLSLVRLKHIAAQGHWLVDRMFSPVVELSTGAPFDGREARAGRLYFTTSYWEDNELKSFPSEFVDWAQGILSWVRRRYVRDKETGEYWGPHAQEWRRSTPGAET